MVNELYEGDFNTIVIALEHLRSEILANPESAEQKLEEWKSLKKKMNDLVLSKLPNMNT